MNSNIEQTMKKVITGLIEKNGIAIPQSDNKAATVVPMESLNPQGKRMAITESNTQVATVPVESHAISSIIDADEIITPEIIDKDSKEIEQIPFSSLKDFMYPERIQATIDELKKVVEPRTPAETEHGLPVTLNGTKEPFTICFNQGGIAGTYGLDDRKGFIVYTESADFWEYQPQTGLWVKMQIEELRKDMGNYIKSLTPNKFWHKITHSRIENCITRLKSVIIKTKVFDKQENIIHVGNGVLEYDSNENQFELKDFSPEYFSRNRTEFDYVAGAECPRFINELLKSALDDDDIELMQKYVGQCLIGRNLSQTFLMLRGTAGGGKSTFANIVDGIVGEKNITELRVPHLDNRFELSRFIGKSLLVGRDVPGTFLNNNPAAVIKKLTGGDTLDAEKKSMNETYPMRGEFNIMLTSNSHLNVKLDSDDGAWERRIIIVDYERARPERGIVEFDKVLLTEEGPGILAWFVEGAVKLFKDFSENNGRLQLTEDQVKRVKDVLSESGSVRAFAANCLELNAASDITGDEALTAYCRFCEAKGWQPKLQRHFERELPDVILELFRKSKQTTIKRDNTNRRGYFGLRLKVPEVAPEAADGQVASEVATE